MKKHLQSLMSLLAILVLVLSLCPLQLAEISAQGLPARTVMAQESPALQANSEDALRQTKAWSAGITLASVGLAGALAMGMVLAKSVESIAKQPEAESGIRGSLMIGLVFIETVVIYALVVAILIVFVL